MRYGLGAAYLRQTANASARVRAWSFRIARLAWVYRIARHRKLLGNLRRGLSLEEQLKDLILALGKRMPWAGCIRQSRVGRRGVR